MGQELNGVELLRMSAQLYATRFGFRVFPVDGKIPFKGTHGFKDASNDAKVIDEMWDAHPGNVAIATGEVSGIDVIDIDPRNGGIESYRKHFFSRTPCVATGGGGLHCYYSHRGTPMPKIVDEGMDVKSDGGYIVAPPSVHPSGNAYRWLSKFHIRDVPLANVPAWVPIEVKKWKKRYESLPDGWDGAQWLIDKLDLRAKKGEYVGLCPFHGDEDPSFYVDFDKRAFICFGCGCGGKLSELVKELDSGQ